MKAIYWIIAAAAFAFAEPASATVGDPEVLLYRVAGVHETGGAAFSGVATAFHCTNFSGEEQNLRIVVRQSNGALLVNTSTTFIHLQTVTVSTKDTILYSETQVMNTGTISKGTAAIAATSIFVTCTAMILDAASTNAIGIALHMTRFNPMPNTQE
jgi:hypothetical protein